MNILILFCVSVSDPHKFSCRSGSKIPKIAIIKSQTCFEKSVFWNPVKHRYHQTQKKFWGKNIPKIQVFLYGSGSVDGSSGGSVSKWSRSRIGKKSLRSGVSFYCDTEIKRRAPSSANFNQKVCCQSYKLAKVRFFLGAENYIFKSI